MLSQSESMIKKTKKAVKKLLRIEDTIWSRAVEWREMRKLVLDLEPTNINALEISGERWENFGFKCYESTSYPEYDICEYPLDRRFDLIIAEHVFEHLLWPYRAGKNLYQMLEEGGHFIISTPFLVRVHQGEDHSDCNRWTETGMKYFLAECGFPLENINVWSWGNRACVKANLETWVIHRGPLFQSMVKESNFPIGVWALAKK